MHKTLYELGIGLKQYPCIPKEHSYYHYYIDHYKYIHEDDRWLNVKGRPSFYTEIVKMSLHSATHVDAICHYALNKVGYNGTQMDDKDNYPYSSDKMPLIHGKAIMLDVAEFCKEKRLASDYRITSSVLDACVVEQGVDISTADIILLRTGQIQFFLDDDPLKYYDDSPGLDLDGIFWFRDKKIIAVGADNYCIEHRPIEKNDFDNFYPSHRVLIGELGLYVMENLNLEELSINKVYEFEMIAAPIRFHGGSASLINPIAMV